MIGRKSGATGGVVLLGQRHWCGGPGPPAPTGGAASCAPRLDPAQKADRLRVLQALANSAKVEELGPVTFHLLGCGE